jgi:threonine/homoserine/homoserine lactone efflux protein
VGVSLPSALGFSLVALTVVLTPGPNMAYLVSRSICQGRRAGMVSLAGVLTAFSLYIVLTIAGLTALLLTIPFAYTSLRVAGVLYLAFIAFQTLKPGGKTPFEVSNLTTDTTTKLYMMGLLTNLLNPKAALLYLSLLPQFIDPFSGPAWMQIWQLALIQLVISATVNTLIIWAAGWIADRVRSNPLLAKRQRVAMGTVLGGLALRMALDTRE